MRQILVLGVERMVNLERASALGERSGYANIAVKNSGRSGSCAAQPGTAECVYARAAGLARGKADSARCADASTGVAAEAVPALRGDAGAAGAADTDAAQCQNSLARSARIASTAVGKHRGPSGTVGAPANAIHAFASRSRDAHDSGAVDLAVEAGDHRAGSRYRASKNERHSNAEPRRRSPISFQSAIVKYGGQPRGRLKSAVGKLDASLIARGLNDAVDRQLRRWRRRSDCNVACGLVFENIGIFYGLVFAGELRDSPGGIAAVCCRDVSLMLN